MHRLAVYLTLAVGLTACPASSAALFTHKATASPGANPDAGTVNAWIVTLTSTNGGQNGSFQGNSANNGDGNGAGAGSSAWALYANSGQTARATTTGFNTLSDVSAINMVGQFISLNFDNGFIDNGGSVGVTFRDSSNNEQFTFRFLGGNSSYQFTDLGNTNANTTKGFTDDGFNMKLLLTNNSGGYLFTAGATTISGTLRQNNSTIGSVQVFNAFAGGGSQRDVFFDNLTLSTTAIPEVSAVLAIPVALIAMGVGAAIRRIPQGAAPQ